MKQKEAGLFSHSDNVKIDVFKFKAFDKLGLMTLDRLFFSYYKRINEAERIRNLLSHAENFKIDVFKFEAFDEFGLMALDSLFFSYYLLRIPNIRRLEY